jgi:hypothetical protein
MITNITTDGATAVQAEFEATIRPMLERMAEIAEACLAAVEHPPLRGDRSRNVPSYLQTLSMEKRMKYANGLVPRELIAERERLRVAASESARDANRRLTEWLQGVGADVERARATDDPDRPAAERRAQMEEADGLSRLPAQGLVTEARRLLAAGDVRGAETRMKAARLTGELNPRAGDLGDLAKAIDGALDRTLPHRRAAIDAQGMARLEYLQAQVAIGEVTRLAADIARQPDGDLPVTLASVREWLAR